MKAIILAAVVSVFSASATCAQNLSANDLTRRTIERRAVEAVIWGMPAVNYDLMLQAAIGAGGKA